MAPPLDTRPRVLGPPLAPPRVLIACENYVFAISCGTLIVNWRREVTLEGVRSLTFLLTREGMSVPGGKLAMFAVKEALGIHPSVEARDELDRMAKKRLTIYFALVMLGDDDAAIRRLVSGQFALMGSGIVRQVFPDVIAAADWAEKVGPPGTSAAELVAAVEAVRRVPA